jgi:hypothetical protein
MINSNDFALDLIPALPWLGIGGWFLVTVTLALLAFGTSPKRQWLTLWYLFFLVIGVALVFMAAYNP